MTGQWYLAVTCRNCGVEFPFSREEELIETYSTDSAQLVLTCPDCHFPLASGHHNARGASDLWLNFQRASVFSGLVATFSQISYFDPSAPAESVISVVDKHAKD